MASARPRIFLDTSAIFAAIWSTTGGARALLELGEGAFLNLVVSHDVLAEIEGVVRQKAPDKLPTVAVLLHQARIDVTPSPSMSQIETCNTWVAYEPDAVVLAGALNAAVDYFVTPDKKHFLANHTVREALSAARVIIGTPGDCLAWYRERLSSL
jgi:predicted nucleic acid-binding protein